MEKSKKIQKSTVTFESLPDTLTPLDYMEWRNCGRAIADAVFHSKGFPRLENTGTKLLADKRAVLLYELGLSKEDKEIVLKELAKEMIGRSITND